MLHVQNAKVNINTFSVYGLPTLQTVHNDSFDEDNNNKIIINANRSELRYSEKPRDANDRLYAYIF